MRYRELESLFSQSRISEILEARRSAVSKEVASVPRPELMSPSFAKRVQDLVEKFRVNVPVLGTNAITVTKPRDAEIDVSGDPRRHAFGSRPKYVKGVEVSFLIPYSGDRNIFYARPSKFDYSPPRAMVGSAQLEIPFSDVTIDTTQTRTEFDRILNSLQEYLGWLRADVEEFNASLGQFAADCAKERRRNVQESEDAVRALGFPVQS